MKAIKITGIILSALMLCTAVACSQQNGTGSSDTTTAEPTTAAATAAAAAQSEVQTAVEKTIEENELEGVVYAVKDGSPIASFAAGTLENGEEITLDTPLPIGSVSKQFCAAAVLLLQEQGKLSIDDTVDKYYPEYSEGKKITVKNLLSMRSGVPEMTAEGNENLVSNDNSEAENTAAIKAWIFKQPLDFEPGSSFEYTNTNYFLLGNIVEQVAEKPYAEFLRDSFFTPLGMAHTGTIGELAGSPEWANGVTFKQVDTQPGLTKGCGDIISNAADMTLWLNALSGGKAVSSESYSAMTTDYSPEEYYGFGMFLELSGGVGHYGAIGIYSAFDYINTDKNLTLFVACNNINPIEMNGVAADLTEDVLG